MSDTAIEPGRSLLQSLAKAGASLLAIYAFLVFRHRDRLEVDCGCSETGGWALSIAAGLILLAIAAWFLAAVRRHWRTAGYGSIGALLADQWRHLGPALVPWTMAILGVVLLTVPEQTEDMLAGLRGQDWTDFNARLLPFALGAGAWAMAIWFCGRWSIDIENQVPSRHDQWLATWNPRLFALIAGMAIVYMTTKSAGLCSPAAVVASLVVSVVFLFALLRRDLWLWLDPLWQPAGRQRRHARGALMGPKKSRLGRFADDMRAAPGGIGTVLTALVVSVVAIAAFGIDPAIAGHLEAPGTVLLGLGCLTMIATFVTKANRRITGYPIFLGLALLTIAMGSFHVGVNHDIRVLPASGPETQTRSIHAAAKEWLATCGEHLWDKESNEVRAVLVTTAGGASRAALWTFHALSALEENDPRFPDRVFAVSAVSGGALGATVWSALLAHDNFDCARAQPDLAARDKRRADGHEILKGDFLAPVLASWLARDVPLGILPLNPFLRFFGLQIEDRAAALERAWEDAWAKQMGTTPTHILANDFAALWGPTVNRPILLLNGTVEDAGLPALTAPVSTSAEGGPPLSGFPTAYDARAMIDGHIRASTAALNAARFPVVSPQGDIRIRRCPDRTLARGGHCASGTPAAEQVVSIVDGGYFDNIGGGTTMWAAETLRDVFAADPTWKARGTHLRIMVVGISSNPDLRITAPDWAWIDPKNSRAPVDRLMRCGQGAPTLDDGGKSMGNALDAQIAPLLAIVATQSGHTVSRMAELNRRFCGPLGERGVPGQYIVLSLCPARNVPLPLNWVMPPVTQAFFGGQAGPDGKTLTGMCGNDTELAAYGAWVNAPRAAGKSASGL